MYAVVKEIETNRVKVQLRSDNTISNIPYYYLATYTPTKEDVVLVDTKLKIVIGKVVL